MLKHFNLNKNLNKKDSYPDYWAESSQEFVIIKVDSEDLEYQKVKREFRKTADNKITKIERIQNKMLWNIYQSMHQSWKPQKEVIGLWHGGHPDAIASISQSGTVARVTTVY